MQQLRSLCPLLLATSSIPLFSCKMFLIVSASRIQQSNYKKNSLQLKFNEQLFPNFRHTCSNNKLRRSPLGSLLMKGTNIPKDVVNDSRAISNFLSNKYNSPCLPISRAVFSEGLELLRATVKIFTY